MPVNVFCKVALFTKSVFETHPDMAHCLFGLVIEEFAQPHFEQVYFIKLDKSLLTFIRICDVDLIIGGVEPFPFDLRIEQFLFFDVDLIKQSS